MDHRIPSHMQKFLKRYYNECMKILPDNVLGIYLYGSVALSGYEEGRSDIDFITVLIRDLTAEEKQKLEDLHRQLRADDPLGARLDGVYLSCGNLGKTNEELAPYPYCANGMFKPAGHWDINHVTWWILKTDGIAVAGPPVKELHLLVTWEDVVKSMDYNLHSYWAGKGRRPYLFLTDEWVEFAVVTLCRIQITLAEKRIVTKTKALELAQKNLPSQWHPLLLEAQRLRLGKETKASGEMRSRFNRAMKTRAFIRYSISYCDQNHLN